MKKFIIINNIKYDITNFNHPGGNVINYMLGQDATHAFKEFHYRSNKASKYLKTLPVIENKNNYNVNNDLDMLEDFKIFRNNLEKDGFFESNYYHIFYRIIELILMFGIGCYFIPINIYLSLIIFTLFSGRCGWIQHEGGHNSLTCNMKIDKIIQNIFIGFGLLTDGSMWNSMHNKHHATPQKINYDMDLNTTPLVAFYDTAIEKNKTKYWSKLWLKYQAYTFLPLTSGILVMLFWIFFLHPKKVIRDKNTFQAIILIFSHVIRTYVFYHFGNYTILQSYLLLIITMWATGIYLFGHFSLSHTFTPVVDENENKNWVRYAIEHSIDINPQNPLINWIMGYLNCQVIHHLFPTMPQYKQPEVSRRLINFCKKWNIKYTILGYSDAWYLMFKNLNDVGKKYN
jgi:fatty acid desaturase 2 (delta-6 desaturase)